MLHFVNNNFKYSVEHDLYYFWLFARVLIVLNFIYIDKIYNITEFVIHRIF